MSNLKTSNEKFANLKISTFKASKLNTLDSTAEHNEPTRSDIETRKSSAADDPRQRGLMVGSLCLLLVALSIVLWHDREFWFPDSPDEDADQPAQTTPASNIAPLQLATAPNLPPPAKAKTKSLHSSTIAYSRKASQTSTEASAPPSATPEISSRTVLPPLEVEVVAGDSHRVVRPGNNAVRVDLQPGVPAQPAPDSAANDTKTAANITSNASERVEMSTDTSAVLTSPVKPNYPLLARQMKVQGSVILQALIGRDGAIQNLRLVSGPRILASAAEDAVRQWHFKPHYEGSEAVETQAKITVNFTISTN
jgi:protein TonB